jgi:hypothetical protein
VSSNLCWPYIAGFFDGEGSVILPQGRGYITPVVQIYQGGPFGQSALCEIGEWIAPFGINSRVSAGRSGHGKTVYVLRLDGRQSAGQFLINVLPYLKIKKTAAQDVLRFIRIYKRRDGRKDYWRHGQCGGIAAVVK